MSEPLKKLMRLLPEETDCAVIMSEENLNYFLDFSADNGTLVVSHDDAFFFTDSRYITAATEKIKDAVVFLQQSGVYETLLSLFRRMGYGSAAFEATKVTVSGYANIRDSLKDCELDFSGRLDNIILMSLRRSKSLREIEKIERAQHIAEDCFDYICPFISGGVTEKEIQLKMDYYMLSHGADALSFNTIVVSGKNSAKPHGVPGSKIIENGDFVTLDFGAVVDFYHSDMTRTVCVGKATEKMKKVYDTVLEAQLSAIAAAQDGVFCSAVDEAARRVIENAGFGEYFRHSTGHGVGVEIHEQPCFSPSSTDIFSKGDVVTVEPGIYIPDEFGVRIEDMLYNDGEKVINLTHADKNLKELY